ncbi:Glycosyltransferase involved in cell wall bisynthesis [Candidatus Methanophagaceae archaeon]|nr:Glycosyltransferase involved in cell wall bisynthesis [Methanophagales archaeon]
MRILVVQESDWLKRNPHQQHHLMERLSQKAHEIRVIDYDIDWGKEEHKKRYTKRAVFENVHKIYPEANIQVIRPATLKIPVLEYLSLWFAHKKELKRQIREFKPEVIVGFGIINTYLAAKIAKKRGIPFVYYWIDVLHTLIAIKQVQFLGSYLEKSTLKNSSRVIAINKKLAEFVTAFGAAKEKTCVIGAGIDLARFNPELDGHEIREVYGLKEGDIVLFFMGWLYHFAGLKEVALELANKKEEKPNLKLIIVGEGDAFEDLKQICEDYDLVGQLILTGKQPYEKIPEFIAAADICLLPAYPNETIMQDIVPIKLYEYMAMGKPVITTRLPGVMTEFGCDNGVIYVDTPEDVLKEAIVLVKNERAKEEGIEARRFVETYSWDSITDEFERVLEDVITDNIYK